MASLLCICDQGYRASIEEQDDTVLWMAHMLQRNEGTRATVLLRGSAVNYANRAQRSVPLKLGDWVQSHPADFPRDLARFQDDGGVVLVLAEDLVPRGLSAEDLVPGARVVREEAVPGIVAEHDLLSFW